MNSPAMFPGDFWRSLLGWNYKFSQANWNPDNLNETTLQVLYDPGWPFKWTGSLGICIGIALMFYFMPSAPPPSAADAKRKNWPQKITKKTKRNRRRAFCDLCVLLWLKIEEIAPVSKSVILSLPKDQFGELGRRNIEILADFPRQKILNLVVAWNSRATILGCIAPPGMISALANENAAVFGQVAHQLAPLHSMIGSSR